MKNNFIAKHMHTCNKSSVHKNLKRESILNDSADIQEGMGDYMNTYYKPQHVTVDLIERYEAMCMTLVGDGVQPIRGMPNDETNPIHLLWMLRNLKDSNLTNIHQEHRWIGFIQGVLICKGVTTVEEERDYTRDIFKG